jgi:hypothetical protein
MESSQDGGMEDREVTVLAASSRKEVLGELIQSMS